MDPNLAALYAKIDVYEEALKEISHFHPDESVRAKGIARRALRKALEEAKPLREHLTLGAILESSIKSWKEAADGKKKV
jgi:hypothetical protein